MRLADRAVRELVASHPVHTHELAVSLRAFVRNALDLDPIPTDLTIVMQGPTRPAAAEAVATRTMLAGAVAVVVVVVVAVWVAAADLEAATW